MSKILQQVQYYDKYARYNYETGTREDWSETVQRVTEYLFSFDKNNVLSEEDKQDIHTAILKQDVMPSMRNLAMAGPAAARQNVTSYNCSAVVIDNVYAFYEAVIILMSGSGLGYSVEKRFTDKLPPVIKQYPYSTVNTLIIPDNTEGWADAIYTGIRTWLSGKDLLFNFKNIRPAGAPLKVKGGRASGPQVLKESLVRIREIIFARQGEQLRPIDVHDIMCHIAKCIVSGGSRRSAMIAIFDLDDTEMLSCKDSGNIEGNEQRYLSNNSAGIMHRMSYEELESFMNRMFDSYSGEPGIFSRYAIEKTLPERRKYSEDMIPNPCFAPGTMIQTREGHFPIESLVGKTVELWDGNSWIEIDNFRITGTNQEVYNIELQDGSEIVTTGNHSFVLEDGERIFAQYLTAGDKLKITDAPQAHGTKHVVGAYLKGFLTGDGTTLDNSRPLLFLYHTKYMCEDRLIGSASELPVGKQVTNSISTLGFSEDKNGRKVMRGLSIRNVDLHKWTSEYKIYIPSEIFEADLESKLEYIAGVMDADGTAFDTRNGFAYQITTVHKKWLQDFQTLLKTIGVNSKISFARQGGMTDFNDGYGEYKTKDTWRLTISQAASIELSKQVTFSRLTDFSHKTTSYVVKPKFNTVVSVEKSHIEPNVYCCTVPTTHQLSISCGIDIGQCGEIVLRGSGQFCNLSSVVARPDDSLAQLKDKVRIAAIIGTLQAMSQHFPGLRQSWVDNQEEERLLGVDLNGVMDVPGIRDARVLQILKNTAIDTNKEYAIKLGINPATAVTCVKPSGNSSVLLDTSPGIHARWSDFYIRRVQLHESNPILSILRMYGVPTEPSNHLPHTHVASFPVKAPDGAITNGAFNALQQLENWKLFKENWAEHSVSCTIAYREPERKDIIQWLYDNQDIISGLSFLPKDDHTYAQAPYEKITAEKYYELMKTFPTEIDWSVLHELEKGLGDTTNGSSLAACSSDKCLVSF